MTNSTEQTLDMPDGRVVAFADQGEGPAVLLIHAGVFADWFPLVAGEPALGGHRVIRLRRAGYVARHPPTGSVSLADHAAHAAALLDHLGLTDVTVVGHSSGSLVAAELAANRTDLVSALLLIEPAPGGALADPELVKGMAEIFAENPGDPFPDAIFDRFMTILCAPDYRDVLTRSLGPNSVGTALQESRYFFTDEVPAVNTSPFGPQDAANITCPAVVVVGSASAPPVHAVAERLASWIPRATVETMADGDHLLPFRQPGAVAARIATLAAGADL